jgi:hypothetical protein
MLFTLIKILCILAGLCLSTEFAYKGLKKHDIDLFYEGVVILLVTGLLSLIIF